MKTLKPDAIGYEGNGAPLVSGIDYWNSSSGIHANQDEPLGHVHVLPIDPALHNYPIPIMSSLYGVLDGVVGQIFRRYDIRSGGGNSRCHDHGQGGQNEEFMPIH